MQDERRKRKKDTINRVVSRKQKGHGSEKEKGEEKGRQRLRHQLSTAAGAVAGVKTDRTCVIVATALSSATSLAVRTSSLIWRIRTRSSSAAFSRRSAATISFACVNKAALRSSSSVERALSWVSALCRSDCSVASLCSSWVVFAMRAATVAGSW